MSELIVEANYVDWSDFGRRVRSIIEDAADDKNDSRYLFRGQSQANWGLQAGFDRLVSGLGETERQQTYERYMADFENAVVAREFIDIAARLTAAGPDSKDLFECLAQHYGAPTRLLDWSASPYVAAYFAVASAPDIDPANPVIWALDTKVLREVVTESNCRILNIMPPGVARPFAQFGRFTSNSSVFTDLVELIQFSASKRTTASPVLYKLVLNTGEAQIAFADLAFMGISSSRLFPDLEGLAREHRRRILARLGRR